MKTKRTWLKNKSLTAIYQVAEDMDVLKGSLIAALPMDMETEERIAVINLLVNSPDLLEALKASVSEHPTPKQEWINLIREVEGDKS